VSRADAPRLPAHQITTRNLGAAYPLVAEPGLGHRGVLIGHDLLGGSFVYDPFELYAQGLISNPNMIVFGQIGRGKSAFVKTYLWRQAVFGRRAWVVDPKGEYGALAAAWGVRPVALRPGGAVRLNPLDPGPAEAPCRPNAQEADRRQTELLASLAAACLGRPLAPRERVAVDLALAAVGARAGVATLPAVVEALLAPSTEAARLIRTERATLLEDGRDVALELRRLVHGDLRGMFDGPTTPGLDLSGPLVVLDLSALYNSAALGVLMACATAWLQAALARQAAAGSVGAAHVLVVVDEAWAILANLGVARWLQASWKLSRAYGVANVAVLHRLSDLHAVGVAEVADILDGAGVPEALQAARASWLRDERQRSSVLTTAETVLEPFAEPAPPGAHPGAPGPGAGAGPPGIDPEALLSGSNTLYVCAPAHDQRRLRGVFTALVKQVLNRAFTRSARLGRPLSPPLLVVLDEAANIAPLAELDGLAATCAGHGVQLVTVWQDVAQISARYGARSATVLNNHRAKLFLSGTADASTLDQASHLVGDESVVMGSETTGAAGRSTTAAQIQRRLLPPDALRRLPTGTGVLVYGGLPAARLALRPWWEDPLLAARGGPAPGAPPGRRYALRRGRLRADRPPLVE